MKSSTHQNTENAARAAADNTGMSGYKGSGFAAGPAVQRQQELIQRQMNNSAQPIQRYVEYKDKTLNEEQVRKLLAAARLSGIDEQILQEALTSENKVDLLTLIVALSSQQEVSGEQIEEIDKVFTGLFQQEIQPLQPSSQPISNSNVSAPVPQLPNPVRACVGEGGYGVFNLFSYAGKCWIATAHHCIDNITGHGPDKFHVTKFPSKGAVNAVPFFIIQKWVSNAKLVLENNDYDFVLFEVEPAEGNFPEIELGSINPAVSESLILNTPRVHGGVSVNTSDTRSAKDKRNKMPERFAYPNGLLKYTGGQPGDSGSALTNQEGKFVGLHHSDFGGYGFQEGKDIHAYLSDQKK